MASIETRNGKHTVRWRKLNGLAQRRACPKLSTARELKVEVEAALSLGRDWEPALASGDPAIEAIATAYMQERALLGASRATLRVQGSHLDLFKRFLKWKQPSVVGGASMLSRPLMMEFLAWLSSVDTTLNGKKPREPATLRKVLSAVELMWLWAEDSERWPGQIPRPRRVDFPTIPTARVVAPTWAEMDACVLASRGWNRKLMTWLRYTGLRVGESMMITWSDIDMHKGLLDIRPEVDKMGIGRTIPISPLILDEIATWGKREGFLIPCRRKKNGEPDVRARDHTSRAWKRAGVREAVWKRRPDHAFRRGIKSGLLSVAHPDAIDFLQGHSLGTGSRGRYIDGAHLPLLETVALVPAIGIASNVSKMPRAI